MFHYDASPDGRRVLVNRYVEPAQTPPLRIILHATNGD
jgi:hypothetical protein